MKNMYSFIYKSKLKKVITLASIFSIMLGAISFSNDVYTLNQSDLVAEAAILINQDTGQILFSKNSHTPIFPASTTKILTGIIILEDMNLDDKITITKDMEGIKGSAIALDAGEVLTVNELLHALLIVSANDAAEALAKTHSGSIEEFSRVMNEKAASLGALSTNFTNPHGLPDKDHLTSAYDLALMAKYAMENETFRKIIMTPRFEIPANSVKTETRYLNNSNKFIPGVPGSTETIPYRGKNITKGYDLMTGVKRGYTSDAGNCYVGSIEKDGRRFISVIIKSSGNDLYIDTRKLLDYGLYGTKGYKLYEQGEPITSIVLNDKRNTTIELVAEKMLSIDLPENLNITDLSKNEIVNDNIVLPVKKGEVLGYISYTYGEATLAETALVASDDYIGDDLVTNETLFFNKSKFRFINKASLLYLIPRLIAAILLWRTIVTAIRLRRRKIARLKRKKELRKLQKKNYNTSAGV